MLFSSRIWVRLHRVRIICSVWLVTCQAYVFILLSVVIVTLPDYVSVIHEIQC